MRNIIKKRGIFSIQVTDEQKAFAKELTSYSFKHHPVKNIENDIDDNGILLNNKEKWLSSRFLGTLGEIVFADVYGLPRKTKSYGAIDGQDMGIDFVVNHIVTKQPIYIDIKTMHRNESKRFMGYHVVNIPARYVDDPFYQTNCFVALSYYPKIEDRMFFCGSVKKDEVVSKCNREHNGNSRIGQKLTEKTLGAFWARGDERIRANGSVFRFAHDVYEVEYHNMDRLRIPLQYEGIKIHEI